MKSPIFRRGRRNHKPPILYANVYHRHLNNLISVAIIIVVNNKLQLYYTYNVWVILVVKCVILYFNMMCEYTAIIIYEGDLCE